MEIIKYEQFLEKRDPNKKYKLVRTEYPFGSIDLEGGYYLDESGVPFEYSRGMSNFVISQSDTPITIGPLNFDRWELVYLGEDISKYSWIRLNDLNKVYSLLNLPCGVDTKYNWESSKPTAEFLHKDGCYKLVDKKTGIESEFCLTTRSNSYSITQYIANDKFLAKKPEEFLILEKELTFIYQVLNEKGKTTKNVD